MKPKTMILMAVAITCGLGASYMTSQLLAQRKSETEKVSVLVLRKPLSLGDPIKNPEELFEEKAFEKDSEPKGAITDRESLKGKIMKRALRAGDHITSEDVLDRDQGGLGVHLAPGFKAVGIRVNTETIAGGFAALPNSRVDVIWTCRRATDKESFSKVLLEDVLVIAADTITARPENGQAITASVVSLALTTEDLLKLNLAKENGSISLVLRKFNDKSKSNIEQVNLETVRNGNVNKKEDVEDGTASVDPSVIGPTPLQQLNSLPPIPKTEKKIAKVAKEEPKVVKEEPKPTIETTTHVLTIVEGDRQRQVQYQLDKAGQVVNTNVNRSDLGLPPRPETDVPGASKVIE